VGLAARPDAYPVLAVFHDRRRDRQQPHDRRPPRHPDHEQARHLTAIAALCSVRLVGLNFLPVSITGPLGNWVGTRRDAAGHRAPGSRWPSRARRIRLASRLDMKRVAVLVVGLSVVVPFLVGVTHYSARPPMDPRFPPG
jgi:hypothetical protein